MTEARKGRPPIHGEAMTGAQRQARSRANRLGEVAGQLEVMRLMLIDRRAQVFGRADIDPREVEFLSELELHLDLADAALLRSA